MAKKDKYLAGEFVRTGFDYLGELTPIFSARSSYFGIVDLCGIPKDRYYLYQSHWRPDYNMMRILPLWNWEDSTITQTRNNFEGVTCYYSTDLINWEFEGYVLTPAEVFGDSERKWGPYLPENDMQVSPGAEDDYAHISQTGFFYTVKGSKKETVIFCGDRWADFAGNGLGYIQWCPLSFDGYEPCKMNLKLIAILGFEFLLITGSTVGFSNGEEWEINLKKMKIIGEVDVRYQSFNVEMCEVVGEISGFLII